MDDLISRQAAIKAICEDGTWLESQGCTEITMAERKQRDADILGELPSADNDSLYKKLNEAHNEGYDVGYWAGRRDYEQKWIPCGERMPEPDERVLVYTVGKEFHVWDAMPHRAESYAWEDEEGLYHSLYEVDLWMPLPEPYKEGEQDG